MAVGILGLRPVLVDGLGGGAMIDQKMREAFEVWWRAVLNDLYSEVGIDDKYIARLAWNAALAQQPNHPEIPESSPEQPAAVVELTDAELVEVIESLGHGSSRGLRKVCRAVIAAHEDKKNGGVW